MRIVKFSDSWRSVTETCLRRISRSPYLLLASCLSVCPNHIAASFRDTVKHCESKPIAETETQKHNIKNGTNSFHLRLLTVLLVHVILAFCCWSIVVCLSPSLNMRKRLSCGFCHCRSVCCPQYRFTIYYLQSKLFAGSNLNGRYDQGEALCWCVLRSSV